MEIKNVEDFVYYYTNRYEVLPEKLLLTSKAHFHQGTNENRYDFSKRCTGLYVEIRRHHRYAKISGKFNDLDALTFKPITQHLYKCDQHFSEMNSLRQENNYLIDIEFEDEEIKMKHFNIGGVFLTSD